MDTEEGDISENNRQACQNMNLQTNASESGPDMKSDSSPTRYWKTATLFIYSDSDDNSANSIVPVTDDSVLQNRDINIESEGAVGTDSSVKSAEPERENISNEDCDSSSLVPKMEKQYEPTKCDTPIVKFNEVPQITNVKDLLCKDSREEIEECEMEDEVQGDIACSLEHEVADDKAVNNHNRQLNEVNEQDYQILNSKTLNPREDGDTSNISLHSRAFNHCNKISKICSFNDKSECDENAEVSEAGASNQNTVGDTYVSSEAVDSENPNKKTDTEDWDDFFTKIGRKKYSLTDTHETATGITFNSENTDEKETKTTANIKNLNSPKGLLTSDVDLSNSNYCVLTMNTPKPLTSSTLFTNDITNATCGGTSGPLCTDKELATFRQMSLESNPFDASSHKPVSLFSTISSDPPSFPLLPYFHLHSSSPACTSTAVSKTYNLFPEFTNSNNFSLNSAEKTKVSFSFPLKTEPSTGFTVSNVFSNMPASKNSSAVNSPLKHSSVKATEISKSLGSSPIKQTAFKFFLGNTPTSSFNANSSNIGAVQSTSSFSFESVIPSKSISSFTDSNTNTAPGNIFKSETFGQNIFFTKATKQSDSSLKFGQPCQIASGSLPRMDSTPNATVASGVPSFAFPLSITTKSNNFGSPSFSFNFGTEPPGKSSGSSQFTGIFGSKPLPGSDCKLTETNTTPFKIFGGKYENSLQVTSSNPSARIASPVLSKAEPIIVSTTSSTLFAFGSSQCQNTGNGFSALNSSSCLKPFSSTSTNGFNSGQLFNGFNIGTSSTTTSNSVLFNFKPPEKKSKQKSPRHIIPGQYRTRPQKPTPIKSEVPFRVVTEADTYMKYGVTHTITTHHQHITAMPEYSSLSFEELRLQFPKYNTTKPTETKSSVANKKVQTTENWDEESHLMEMWKILECPVCLEIVSSPIIQCERGHHVCNQCWKRVNSCPLCKHYRSRTRNYVAEAMVEKLPLPCKYRVDGCMKTMRQTEKAAHEESCLFRTYSCLVDNCSQSHSYIGMTVHLRNSHSHLMSGSPFHIGKGQKFTRTLVKRSFESLVHAFDIAGWGLFFLCHKLSGQNTCLWIQAISTGISESQFLYIVEVADIQGLRSVSYKGPVLPLHRVVSEDQKDCLIVTDTLLDTLKKNFGFHVKISVWRRESVP